MVLSLFLMGAKVQISYYMASLGIKKPPTSYPSKKRERPHGCNTKREALISEIRYKGFLI